MNGTKVDAILGPLERIFVISSMLLYMQAVIPLFIIQGASEGDGVDLTAFNYTFLNLLYLTNYFITLTLLFLRWHKVLSFLLCNTSFLLLLIMAPISYTWSANPEATFSGSIGLIGSTMFGIYVATRFKLRQQIELLAWAFGIAIFLSFFLILALPKYGVMAAIHDGALRGVWVHKNITGGKYMVMSNWLFLLLLLTQHKPKWLLWIGLASSLALTLGSNSTNGLVSSALIIVITLFLNQFLRLSHGKTLVVFLFLGLFLTGLLITLSDITSALLELVGKDATLTGRTDIWALVIEKIQERPWLGYGFSGFWRDGVRGEAAFVIRAVRWPVTHSHNGYLEFVLQLGLVGFLIFLGIYWATLIKAYLLVRQEFCLDYLWTIIALIFLIQINFAEPSLLTQNDFFWILLTMIIMSISAEFKRVFHSQNIAQVYQGRVLVSAPEDAG